MKKAFLIAATFLLSGVQPLYAVERGGVVVSYSESLQDFSVQAAAARAIADNGSSTLVFDALGQRFELELEPNNRLISAVFPRGLDRDIAVYRGRVAGKPDSWARIVVSNGVPSGLIWDGDEMLALEAPAGADFASIYRLRDTYVEPGTMSCGTTGKETSLAAAYATVAGELDNVISNAAGAVEELRIGLIGDFEFTNLMGNNAEAQILARMNNVDGIFSEQLGVQISVEVVETFTNSNDPFTTSVPRDLLIELADYRALTPAQNSQGLTHMFTARNLDGRTAGIAYTNALCSSRFGVGLSEGTRGIVLDSLVAAHEIGHNFGADHDGEAGSVCESVTGEFLMSPSVNGTDQFSSCSIATIRPRIDRAPCINPLPATDMSIALSGNLPTLFLGATTSLVFDIVNTGTEEAANVAATFDIPPNLALDSIAATAGLCTSGAGQASCSIGTVAGNSSLSVALSVTAGSAGSNTLNASVSADGDANLADNAQSLQVVVIPATDLRITNASARSVAVNNAVTISPRVENVSSLEATGVALDISFSGGLRVDSASWPNGTCSIAGNSLSCQRASLAAGSDATLTVQLTAVASGSQTYNVSVSSVEADASAGNNRVTGSINVSSDSGGGSSGGGAFSLFWVVLSGLLVLAARRRRA